MMTMTQKVMSPHSIAAMSRLAHRNSFSVRKLQGRAKVSQRARPNIICALFNAGWTSRNRNSS
ncbi:hypothetical protein Bpfe_007550, partial [Biomphalaria pfeifferi]